MGCESGALLACNRKAKNPTDRVAGAFYGHHGPVYSLARHPFAAKYFLSVGDWTARIWAEDSKQPLITTRYHNTYLTGMCESQAMDGMLRACWCTLGSNMNNCAVGRDTSYQTFRLNYANVQQPQPTSFLNLGPTIRRKSRRP